MPIGPIDGLDFDPLTSAAMFATLFAPRVFDENTSSPSLPGGKQLLVGNSIHQIRHDKVTNRLLEDEVRVFGYDLVQGSEGTYIVRVSQEGHIMDYNSTETNIFQEAPFDEMIIAIVVAEVADEIRSLPDVTPVNLEPQSDVSP